jgi:hypothetical protein
LIPTPTHGQRAPGARLLTPRSHCLTAKDLAAALTAFERAEEIALQIKKANPSVATTGRDLAWIEAQLNEMHRKIAKTREQPVVDGGGAQGIA